MVFVVEMFAGDPEARACESSFRYFACGGDTWKEAVSLGREFGWGGEGTQPRDERSREWYGESGFDGSYAVPDVLGAKVITDSDATAWADALERALLSGRFRAGDDREARRALIVEGRSEAEHQRFNRALSTRFLIDFIAFLRRGGFRFYWDD